MTCILCIGTSEKEIVPENDSVELVGFTPEICGPLKHRQPLSPIFDDRTFGLLLFFQCIFLFYVLILFQIY